MVSQVLIKVTMHLDQPQEPLLRKTTSGGRGTSSSQSPKVHVNLPGHGTRGHGTRSVQWWLTPNSRQVLTQEPGDVWVCLEGWRGH